MLGWVGGENFNAWRESLQIVSAVRSLARVRTTVGVWQPSVEVFNNRILIELTLLSFAITPYHVLHVRTAIAVHSMYTGIG